jgi:hypothetical protein
MAGPTTGCTAKKAACTEEKHRVRQPAVRYTQKEKKKKYVHTQTYKNAYTDKQVSMLVCIIV